MEEEMSKDGVKRGWENLIVQAYSEAYNLYGDFGLQLSHFKDHIVSIAKKRQASNAEESINIDFIKSLNTNDLYLSVACAHHCETAWHYFIRNYKKYIHDLATFLCQGVDAARELTDSVLSNLLMPDSSGQSRIASYNGRSSLATWLRVIVAHRSANERERKCNLMKHIESIPDIVDEAALENMEKDLRSIEYNNLIHDCFNTVLKGLTARERLLLLWRYDEGLRLGQIARILHVHQSTVTRRLERIQKRLHHEAISFLASKYHLSHTALEECLSEILENPPYSILDFIKEAPAPVEQADGASIT